MKKIYVAAAIVIVAACVLAVGFGLRPLVENQVRRGIQSVSVTGEGRPARADVEDVTFSPFSRTLSLYGLRLSGQTPQGPVSYEVAEVSLRIPLRMLLAYTPLRSLVLENAGTLTVAQNIVLRGLALRTPTARVSIQREEIDVLHARGDLVARFLDGAPIDALAASYGMGADTARSFFVSVDMPGKDGLAQLTMKESLVRGWKGAAVDSVRMEELHSRLNGRESLHVAGFECSGITLPGPALLRRLADAADLGETDPDAAVKAMGPIVEEILGANPPLVKKMRAMDMTFAVDNSRVTINGAGFDWLSNAPDHTTSFIHGLSAPRALLLASTGLALPDLKADMTFENLAISPASHQKTITVKAAGLADASCVFTLYDAGSIASEQALLLQSFSDLRLSVDDHGAMAWLAHNLSPDAGAAAAMLRGSLDKGLSLTPTPQNTAVREALLTFAQRPGRLEIRSARGRRIGILPLLAAFSDPGALFTCRATPGQRTLEEQISALAPQTAAPAGAAGK